MMVLAYKLQFALVSFSSLTTDAAMKHCGFAEVDLPEDVLKWDVVRTLMIPHR